MRARVKAGMARCTRGSAGGAGPVHRGRQPRDPRRSGESAAGSVLVADVGDVTDRGYWGEVLTTGAESRGSSGLVIDGGVRDVDAHRGTRFPGLLGGDRVAWGDEAVTWDRRTAGRWSAECWWLSETGWSVTADGVTVVPGAAVADGSRSRPCPGAEGGRDVREAPKLARPRSSCSASIRDLSRWPI